MSDECDAMLKHCRDLKKGLGEHLVELKKLEATCESGKKWAARFGMFFLGVIALSFGHVIYVGALGYSYVAAVAATGAFAGCKVYIDQNNEKQAEVKKTMQQIDLLTDQFENYSEQLKLVKRAE